MSLPSSFRKRPPDKWEQPLTLTVLPGADLKASATVGGDLKRRRLDVPSSSTASTPLPTASYLPFTPLLYHLAISAHHAAHRHLQQFFIPSSVTCQADADYPPIVPSSPVSAEPFIYTPDNQAGEKSLGLLSLSLHLLRAGLAAPDLSDKEKVVFGLEFGVVGLKVLNTVTMVQDGKGKGMETVPKVDVERLFTDVENAIGSGLSITRRHPYLKSIGQTIEVLNVRLAFMRHKGNLARRFIRQALEITSSHDISHRYTLWLLLLEHGASANLEEDLRVLNDLHLEAQTAGHTQVLQLAGIARLWFLFRHRRWEDISFALEDLATSFGHDETTPAKTTGSTWEAHVTIHYILFRCLWEGRIGNDSTVKALLKKLYLIMDDTSDRGLFDELRASGGVMQIAVPSTSTNKRHGILLVQVTPPNVTYLLTFLTTLVSRRDFVGSTALCKSLVHSKAMQQFEQVARAEDMWDSNFSTAQGPAEASHQRNEVMTIRAEVMLEEITALLYRSEFDHALDAVQKVTKHLRSYDMWHAYAPHLCLLHAQFAHLLGRTDAAIKAYRACRTLLKPGSELGLLVDVCWMAAKGKLLNILENHLRRDELAALAERCCNSGSTGLVATGHLLRSLTEAERVASKKELSIAYEVSQRSNNNVLRILIFAFTTSVHHFGTSERMLRQLETGRDIACLLGGKDRDDGVGQTVLGLWFAVKLRETHRRDGNTAEHLAARENVNRHTVRIKQLESSHESVIARMKGRS